LATTGSFSFAPNTNANGVSSFEYEINDGNGGTDTAIVTISIDSINDAPQITPVVLNPIEEDSGVRIINQAELLANATDVEGDILTATDLTLTSGNGNLVDNGDGTWNYSPANNDNADVSFTFIVNDSTNNIAGSATLDITPVNDTPISTPVVLTSIPEDSGVRTITQDELLANASDIEGDDLTANWLTIATGNGNLTDNGDGTWNYTPASNDHGDVSFVYSITDATDAIAGLATLNIEPVNDTPQSAPVTITPVAEDSGVRVITQAELLGNAADIEGDVLTAINLSIATGNGTLLDNQDGTWIYTPASNDDTGASFAYTITDGSNNIDGSAILDITPVSDAPFGTDGDIQTTEDTPYTLNSLDFGFSDQADGNTLDFITITSVPNAGTLLHQGNALIPGDTISAASLDAGELVYQPPFNISDPSQNSFGFTVTDNGGVALGGENTSTEQFINIDLVPVNDSPTLVSNGATVSEGGTIVIDSTLLSGTDPDDIEPDELLLTVTTLPLHGQLLLNGEVVTAGSSLSLAAIEAGSLSYIHDESETSADGFNVTLADGGEDGAQPAQGRFELGVTEVIDPPVELVPDTFQLAFGESFDSSKGNVLASGFSSLNNGNLSNQENLLVELEVPPSHGTVKLMPDGTFTYVHNGSAILNDEFSYRVTNEDGIFTIATVTVTIAPPEPANQLLNPTLNRRLRKTKSPRLKLHPFSSHSQNKWKFQPLKSLQNKKSCKPVKSLLNVCNSLKTKIHYLITLVPLRRATLKAQSRLKRRSCQRLILCRQIY